MEIETAKPKGGRRQVFLPGDAEIITCRLPPAFGPNDAAPDGKTWRDMPGPDEFMKRCNFFFYRRGLLSELDN